MNITERMDAFWSGERPDQIPYTIYQGEWRQAAGDPAWQDLYAAGLGVTWHIASFRSETPDLEVVDEEAIEDGKRVRRQIQRTPVGEICATWVEGWHHKYLLETPADYRVMTYIVEHTEVAPCYEAYQRSADALPPWGIAVPFIGRTPLQTMLVDFAGLENFGWHLFEYQAEVRALYDALLNKFRRIVEIVARGPGRFVSNLENFTADSLGPKRYAEFLLPVYEECFPMLHDAGKIVGSHYDGQLSSCKDLIAQSPIDLIESLTPPPEGDMTLDECREAWPHKLFWSNINVGCYQLPPDELRALVLERVVQAAPDGRLLAFEVSEQIPANWRDSLPVVLEALKETRT